MNKIIIPSSRFHDCLKSILSQLQKESGHSLPSSEINSVVSSTLKLLQGTLISNTISPILIYSIDEILEHWTSINTLYPSSSMNLHCRKIFECSLIVRFLIKSENDWNKYVRKWDYYKEVEMFTRWSQMDTDEMHPDSLRQISIMSKLYSKNYSKYEVFFSSKKNIQLTGDLLADLMHFKNVRSWISPNAIENILEKEFKNNYSGNFYSWWSNSIHFSPLNQGFSKIETEFGSFADNSFQNILFEIGSYFKSISKFSTSEKYVSLVSASLYYLFLLKKYESDPRSFTKMLQSNPEPFKALISFASGKIDVCRYVQVAVVR